MTQPRVMTYASVGLLVGVLAFVAPETTHANPEVDITDYAVEMLKGGRQVNASFSGWDDAEHYNDIVHVFWRTKLGWRPHLGTWNTEEAPRNSKDTFYRVIPCLGPGEHKILLMENYSDTLGESFRDLVIRNMECAGAGPLAEKVFGDPIQLGKDDEDNGDYEDDKGDFTDDEDEGDPSSSNDDQPTDCSVSAVGTTSSSAGIVLILIGAVLFYRRRR